MGPAQPILGAGYAALGAFSPARGQEVVVGFFGDLIGAYDRVGRSLPGWPVNSSNYVSTGPSLVRVSPTSSLPMIGEEDWALHAYRPDATPPAGWPATANVGGQERHTPAVGNVDGVAGAEIFTASGWTSPGVYLFGLRGDGSSLPGYPVVFQGDVDTFPAVGDVDGDGQLEVVIVGAEPTYAWRAAVIVITAATGAVEGTRLLSAGVPNGTAPALADLDQDCGVGGLVEIIVQTEGTLEVVRWNGSTFSNYPGWPRTWSTTQWIGNSAPAVGDVDGDGLPDLVITGQVAGDGTNGSVYLYSRGGVLHPRFPKNIRLGSGGAPAIADLDRDGRNEIVVKGSPWNGFSGLKDTLWVYDLGGTTPHGPIHWGQFMHDAAHTGTYTRAYC
ncbi:MAG: FG-GAP repeat domain-containing protein [Actinomycetota bacterium]